MCLHEAIDENIDDYQKYLQMYFQAAIIFSLVWGVAGILNSNSRSKFDIFFKKVNIHTYIHPFYAHKNLHQFVKLSIAALVRHREPSS